MENLENLLSNFMGVDITNTDEIISKTRTESYPRFNPNPKVTNDKTYKAIIRFLPNLKKQDNNLNFHSIPEFSYWLESDTEKIGIQSPVMVGKECIIANTWRRYSKKEDAVSKSICAALKRNTSFYSLIYVVQDFTNPSNTGKIMVYKYGVKIRAKLEKLINPSDEDKAMGYESILPWDLLEGADFRVDGKISAGWANYDDSTFMSKTPFAFEFKSKNNLKTDKTVITKLSEMMQNAPNIDELFAFKEWSSDQTEKVKRIVSYITGESSGSSQSISTILDSSEDELEEGEDDDMDDFLSNL